MKLKPNRKRCAKVAYKTMEAARIALKELRDRGAKRFYLCPYCAIGTFHLTSEQNNP